MKKTFRTGVICAGLLLSGCMTDNEPLRLKAGLQQQAIMRDGYSSLYSKRAHSMVRAAFEMRSIKSFQQPALRVEIRNLSKEPQDVVVDEIRAEQLTGGSPKPLKVYTFEDLVAELEARQTAKKLIRVGIGMATALTQRDEQDQRRTLKRTESSLRHIDRRGADEYAGLEDTMLKDTSVMPGEKYAGYLYLEPPSGDEEKKIYTLHLRVGSDRHDIMIAQGRGPSPVMEAMAQAPGGNPDVWREWEMLDHPVYAFAEPEQRVICTEPSGEVSLYSTLMCPPGAKTPVPVPHSRAE